MASRITFVVTGTQLVADIKTEYRTRKGGDLVAETFYDVKDQTGEEHFGLTVTVYAEVGGRIFHDYHGQARSKQGERLREAGARYFETFESHYSTGNPVITMKGRM